uniref:Chemosensory protein n=1 Tax=Timema monikensis TaxID=170555 RepID=A0A7R9HMM7_9NEOP|nr:unnamed protein product [Timema monikensis]
MNTLTLVTVVVMLATLMSVHAGRLPRENKYTTRYDNINLDDILKSDRLLNFYVDCLLDREKRCSPDAKELKANMLLTNVIPMASSFLVFLISNVPAHATYVLPIIANLPDALHTDCSKCSEKQKEGSDKVIHFLIDNKPELWKELEARFDPQGEYKKKYNGRQHV